MRLAELWNIGKRLQESFPLRFSPCPIFNAPGYGGNRSYGLPLSCRRNSKIVVFGIPKVGNTWLCSLLSDYFQIPFIDPLTQSWFRGVGMSHLPYSPLLTLRKDIIHGVCMVRDLRDVVVSYYYYALTQDHQNARKDLRFSCIGFSCIESFYYDWFLPVAVKQYRIHTFYTEYVEKSVPIIHYENLRMDTAGELSRLIDGWGFHIEHDLLLDSVEKNRFKKQEMTTAYRIIPATHFRKGIIGDYQTELPSKIIDDIGRRFPCQTKWGYS